MALEEWHIYVVIGLLALHILFTYSLVGNNDKQERQLRENEARLIELIEVQRRSLFQAEKMHYDLKAQLEDANFYLKNS